jgi:hypothetical protein
MTETSQTHDPQKTLADLRDHLARHDKPIAFLFGAGTSCAVRIPVEGTEETKPLIPAIAQLTETCRADAIAQDAKYEDAWTTIESHCLANGADKYIESVLTRLRMMISAAGVDDTLAGLTRDEIIGLELSVRKSIATAVSPNVDSIPDGLPHRKLARWLARTSRQSPVEIFTVNYDVLFEHALESERVPIFDGFTGSFRPFFHADSLRRVDAAPGSDWTRLWKMHGSVTWQRCELDGRSRVVRGAPSLDGEMILPSYEKYDESRQQPYSAISGRLARFMEQDDALLIVAGFNFGDEHINSIVFGALESHPRTHTYALQFEEPDGEGALLKRAAQRPNLVVIAPETGVFGARRAPWRATTVPDFMQGLIDVVEPKEGEEGAPSVSVGIGDFCCFCDFLESMAGG